MRRRDGPPPGLRAPRRLQPVRVAPQETMRETPRSRPHRGDFQTAPPEARVCLETPTHHCTSPGGALRHHNLATDPYLSSNPCQKTSARIMCRPLTPALSHTLHCMVEVLYTLPSADSSNFFPRLHAVVRHSASLDFEPASGCCCMRTPT